MVTLIIGFVIGCIVGALATYWLLGGDVDTEEWG